MIENKDFKPMTVHDMTVLMEIYNDCQDYNIKLWNPFRQKEEVIYFCGSSNPDKTINFNSYEIELDETKLWGFDMVNEQILADNNFYIIVMPHKDLSGFWFTIQYMDGDTWKEATDGEDYKKYEDAKKAGLKFAYDIYKEMKEKNDSE